MFFGPRVEYFCERRCAEIQEVLDESMPDEKKCRDIIELIDLYIEEDQQVHPLTGVIFPGRGAVFIPDEPAVVADPEARLASQVSGPSSCSTDGKPPDQPHSSSSAATTTPSGEPCGTSATTSDEAALIEKNKPGELYRRAQMQAAFARSKERQMFECLQWMWSS